MSSNEMRMHPEPTVTTIYQCGVCGAMVLYEDIAAVHCECESDGCPKRKQRHSRWCEEHEVASRERRYKERIDALQWVDTWDGPFYCENIDDYDEDIDILIEKVLDYWDDEISSVSWDSIVIIPCRKVKNQPPHLYDVIVEAGGADFDDFNCDPYMTDELLFLIEKTTTLASKLAPDSWRPTNMRMRLPATEQEWRSRAFKITRNKETP